MIITDIVLLSLSRHPYSMLIITPAFGIQFLAVYTALNISLTTQ